MKNQMKLKKLELAGKERYYYMKFGKGAVNVPDGFMGVATVCLLPVPACDGMAVMRGIAFCNPLDQFTKKLGRNIALGRAIKALESGDSSEPVPQKTPASILILAGMTMLSAFNPIMTTYEQKLINGGGHG